MTFLNPLVLLGLVAAAIPLIIHLFNFRRPRKIDFSSLAFLRELQQTTMRRVRIKQWLLLLLRTLAIACLVLAFARPTLTGGLAGTLGGRPRTSGALVIDNSLSMTLRDDQGQYLDQAKDLAATLIEQMEQDDEVFVLPTSDPSVAAPSAYTNRTLALDAIAEVEALPGAAVISRQLARAAALVDERMNPNKEVYVITDLQRRTLVDSVRAQLPEDVRVVLLPVGERSYSNVAVTGVQVVSRIVEVGQPVRLQATLANYGSEAVENYVASVYLEGERVAQAAADLEAGAATTVSFTATPKERGWLSGVVQIEDDAFEPDNLRYFTLHVPERRRLLVVRGEEQRTDYVTLALSSDLTQGRVAFDLETIPESGLAAAALGTYDAVVLVGPRSLSTGEVAALSRYVEEGGGLLLFPSGSAQAEDYNALLSGLGGGTFSGFSGSQASGRSIAAFDRIDFEHPLFEGVFDLRGARKDPELERPDVYYAMNYSPSSGSEQTLIQLSNGFPFLQEIRHGRGAAFLMAVAPDASWSDLPRRGLFIPLLYRAIYYLSSGESVTGEQLQVGTPGELRLPGVSEAEPLRLVSPDGEEFTPEQRTLFGAVLLQTDASMRVPGVYAVRQGETLIRRVAFNLDSRESDLQTFSAEEAASRLGEATGRDVQVLDVGSGGGARLAETLQAEQTGVELWNVFLLLALMFLIAEMLVAKQWRPEAVPA